MNDQKEKFNSAVNVVSLVLALMNLQENLTQSDKQDIVDNLNKEGDLLLQEIHSHLKKQDEKIDRILSLLKENF